MKLIVFDLDDTLFKERDFVDSAFRNISAYLSGKYGIDYAFLFDALKFNDGNPFDSLIARLSSAGIRIDEDVAWLVNRYRTHFPDISLNRQTIATLDAIKANGDRMAIITDGRDNTQSNKIRALGLDHYVSPENISISEAIGAEKIFALPFERMMKLNPDADSYTYIGDNMAKDFIWPNRLGWTTVMLLDCEDANIHPQRPDKYSGEYCPDYVIESFPELLSLLDNV